jgi:hypothetical protein
MAVDFSPRHSKGWSRRPLSFSSHDARFVDPAARPLRVTAANEDEDVEVRFSVGEVYAETIRNLYVRSIEREEITPTSESQDFVKTEVIRSWQPEATN